MQFGRCYGPFNSRSAVRRFLIQLAAEHRLCLKTIGLEGRSKSAHDGAPCFNYQLRRCRGACVGSEPIDEHTERLKASMQRWLLPVWPFEHAIALIERNELRFHEHWHVFDRWCWLGTVKSFDAARELARNAQRIFEADAARLAVQALSGAKGWKLEVVQLFTDERRAAMPAEALEPADSAHGSASAQLRLRRAGLHPAIE
jgi:DNA polymerase-3 subunit epsilon